MAFEPIEALKAFARSFESGHRFRSVVCSDRQQIVDERAVMAGRFEMFQRNSMQNWMTRLCRAWLFLKATKNLYENCRSYHPDLLRQICSSNRSTMTSSSGLLHSFIARCDTVLLFDLSPSLQSSIST